MQNIISQLEPHLTESARRRVSELQAQFGQTALQESLLPANAGSSGEDADSSDSGQLRIPQPANPDNYYPLIPPCRVSRAT